jgi:hypothetical protein
MCLFLIESYPLLGMPPSFLQNSFQIGSGWGTLINVISGLTQPAMELPRDFISET